MKTILIIGGATTAFLCSTTVAQLLQEKNLALVAVEKPKPQMSDVLQFIDHKPVFKVEKFTPAPRIYKEEILDLPRVRPYQETPTWRNKKRK